MYGKPYFRYNQIDWFGALWADATFVYTGCRQWDNRDWYEF